MHTWQHERRETIAPLTRRNRWLLFGGGVIGISLVAVGYAQIRPESAPASTVAPAPNEVSACSSVGGGYDNLPNMLDPTRLALLEGAIDGLQRRMDQNQQPQDSSASQAYKLLVGQMAAHAEEITCG